MVRHLRFGLQLGGEQSTDPVAAARRAEAVGFDVVLLGDHVGPGPSPFVALAAMAQATSRIRLGTLVLNNDMRHPVQLAWEAGTLDRLSAGRFELGLGAGHTASEYAAAGIPFDPPATRKRRLVESVRIVRRLLSGETVDFRGEYYALDGARVDSSHQERLPILVGGNGAALLAQAGVHADIIGLQGLGCTHPDGHHHDVKWDPAWLSEQIDQIRSGAGDRFTALELNALVQEVEITDRRDAALAGICDAIGGLPIEHASDTPYLLVGTVDEIVGQLFAARDRWGISYIAVRDLEAFAPILAAMR